MRIESLISEKQNLTMIDAIIKSINKLHAKGTILNEHEIIEILKATKKVSDKKSIINTLLHFQNVINSESINNLKSLTSREKEVLQLVGLCKKNKAIAKELNISIYTVESHRKNIIKKLKIKEHGNLLEFAILYKLSKHEVIIKN